MSEFVSIALATFQGTRFLRDQLESFSLQTRLPDELVICDDCSSDQTMQLIEEFKRKSPFSVHVHRNRENLGLTRNFERALSLCRGEIIFFSDQDDYWLKEKIGKTLDIFIKHPKSWLVCTDAEYTDENLRPSGKTVLQHVRRVAGNPSGHIAGSCTAIKREFAEFLLPFPERHCPQYDVYIHRWANTLERKVVSAEVLQYWRIHGAGATAGNEMRSSTPARLINRVNTSLNSEAAGSYLQKSLEFVEMTRVFVERKALLDDDIFHRVQSELAELAVANEFRGRVRESGLLARWVLATRMACAGQYRHFRGFKSFLRDLYTN